MPVQQATTARRPVFLLASSSARSLHLLISKPFAVPYSVSAPDLASTKTWSDLSPRAVSSRSLFASSSETPFGSLSLSSCDQTMPGLSGSLSNLSMWNPVSNVPSKTRAMMAFARRLVARRALKPAPLILFLRLQGRASKITANTAAARSPNPMAAAAISGTGRARAGDGKRSMNIADAAIFPIRGLNHGPPRDRNHGKGSQPLCRPAVERASGSFLVRVG